MKDRLLQFAALYFWAIAAVVVNTADAAEPAEPPVIHYDQTSLQVLDGAPIEEAAYRKVLEGCQKSGLPMHALTPDEVGKLGRIHVVSWIGPQKQSRRTERWHLDIGKSCQFVLAHEDETEIQDASGHDVTIDHVGHKTDIQELGAQDPATPVPAGDGEVDAAAKAAGWSRQGKGVDCAIWQDAQGFQVCVWTGGGKWGYTSYGVGQPSDGVSAGSVIVLWSKPSKDLGWKLQTNDFSVGKALDESAFDTADH